MVNGEILYMVAGLYSTGYNLVWVICYLTTEDVYLKLVEEMKERVGSDQFEKLKSYAYDTNMYFVTAKNTYN